MKIADNFTLVAKDYASQGNTILGIRGSGKSYTATKIAEQLLKDGIPILVFDPTSIWRHLRDGINGNEGFPVVVVGGIQPDIPLPLDDQDMEGIVEKVVVLVRSAMQRGISIVVDLFGMAKSNWQKIVIACIRLLLRENHLYGIRHVFFEEAAEFVPQRVHPGNQVVYGLIEQMARTGRNFGIGYTLINQRAEEIAKAVFELCEMVFVHRQKGKNSLKSIRDWLDHQDIADSKGMVSSIPKLANGECWVISDLGESKIKIKAKQTFHPSPKEGKVTVPHDVKVADTAEFIKLMSAEINKERDKSQKSTSKSKVLKDNSNSEEISVLQEQLTETKKYVFDLQNEIVTLKEHKQQLQNVIKKAHHLAAQAKETNTALAGFLVSDAVDLSMHGSQQQDTIITWHDTIPIDKRKSNPTFIPPGMKSGVNGSSKTQNSTLPKGETNVLTACAQFKNGLSRKALTVITGYTRRTRDAYIFALKNKGLVQVTGEKIVATPPGIRTLGNNFKKLPTGRELQTHWLTNLPQGERTILKLLAQHYPKELTRDIISEKTGYTRRTRDAYIYNMLAKEIVLTPGKGTVKISDLLF